MTQRAHFFVRPLILYNIVERYGVVMDFSILSEYFVMIVLVASLIVGYIIKTSLDFIPNKYIPTILAVFGAALNVFVSGVSVDSIVWGALTGLASTGLHQAFTRFIEKADEDQSE